MTDDLETFAPEVDLAIDPGIRRHVLILRSGGVETFESCEGGEGHASPVPCVRFHGNNGAGFRALAVALDYGLPVTNIALEYPITDGWPRGPWWRMEFARKDKP